MTRQIDINDPTSWDDEDKTYLRDRIERVPAEHRAALNVQPTVPPAATAESTEIDRLRAFLVTNFPDEIGAADDTPVGVAMRLLSEAFETEDVDTNASTPIDTYDSWKVAELQTEVDKRRNDGADLNPASNRKDDLIAALRANDGL